MRHAVLRSPTTIHRATCDTFTPTQGPTQSQSFSRGESPPLRRPCRWCERHRPKSMAQAAQTKIIASRTTARWRWPKPPSLERVRIVTTLSEAPRATPKHRLTRPPPASGSCRDTRQGRNALRPEPRCLASLFRDRPAHSRPPPSEGFPSLSPFAFTLAGKTSEAGGALLPTRMSPCQRTCLSPEPTPAAVRSGSSRADSYNASVF